MIVLPLAGESSRFFKAGFTDVKYKLPLGNGTVIENILEYIPRHEKILIILNVKFNDVIFFRELLIRMSFTTFKIVEINESRGQLETVFKGLLKSESFWSAEDYLTIYNGDTIRKLQRWNYLQCDGLIEVFESSGDHWSFVDKIGSVSLVVEKKRISSYCSSGLYFFKTVSLFLNHYNDYVTDLCEEFFVAPFFNVHIQFGYIIKSELVDIDSFIFCGTPEEYSRSKSLKF